MRIRGPQAVAILPGGARVVRGRAGTTARRAARSRAHLARADPAWLGAASVAVLATAPAWRLRSLTRRPVGAVA